MMTIKCPSIKTVRFHPRLVSLQFDCYLPPPVLLCILLSILDHILNVIFTEAS